MQRPSFQWPKIIGHRGSAGTSPENTLISVRDAFENGVKAVQLDVMLSKDGIPVIFHDHTLERTTNGTGAVADYTVAELKALDAGSWFLPQFAGEPVPTLEEMLRLCAALDLNISLEIKALPGREVETVGALIDITEQVWPADYATPLLTSLSMAALAEALRIKPEWARGIGLSERPANWREMFDEVQATIIAATAKSPTTLLEMVATGRPVYVYTINDVKRARSLFAIGIAGIFTDYPAPMSAPSIWAAPTF